MEVPLVGKPDNVLYVPFDDESVMQPSFTAASARPIDVLYTSSNCKRPRERLVRAIREELERAGLRFEYDGLCRAGSTRARYVGGPAREPALDAKMMVAFSRSMDDNTEALDEKMSKAMRLGCVPLYHGRGQRLGRAVHQYPDAYLNRASYASDLAFARAVVRLAGSPRALDRMQQQVVAYQRRPPPYCEKLARHLAAAPPWLRSWPRGRALTIANNDGSQAPNAFFLRAVQCLAARGAGANATYTWVDRLQRADIEIGHCCWG